MRYPRLLLAAMKSGAGKTTICCGLLRALQKSGFHPAAFKCGPDYIDPLFHHSIVGSRGCNLDLFFSSKEQVRQLFVEYQKGADISIVEGVMGFYDGIAGTTSNASAYELSESLESPVVLVVDVKGASLSLAASIQGMINFRPNRIQGVILNRCSKMMYPMYRDMIEKECGCKVFGYVPFDVEYSIESRHLGLVTALEIEALKDKIDKLSEIMLQSIDLTALVELAREVSSIEEKEIVIKPVVENKTVLAVARDKAFCFYYRENLDVFQKLGVEIVEFSPLTDVGLPESVDGIYLGGGYPELYLKELEANQSMRESIRLAIEKGIPALAECGGFMYLLSQIEGFNMVGAIQGTAKNTEKLSRFGYIHLQAKESIGFVKAEEEICGHEFHYYDSDHNGTGFVAQKPLSKRSWEAFVVRENLLAGYPHLYFHQSIDLVKRFVSYMEKCQEDRV